MLDPSPTPDDRDGRLDEILGQCLQAVDQGDTLPLHELCDLHPDLADDLRRFFAQHQQFAYLASPLREALHSDGKAGSPSQPRQWTFLAPAQLSDEIGRLGNFRILEPLGEGGMGIVFVAEDLHLQRRIAVKVMKPHIAEVALSRQRFLREARALAAVQHEHIVAIHYVGEEHNVPFLVMPLLRGESLKDRLRRTPGPTWAESTRIGREIGEGLAAMHAAGLIHRDIKPSNIWLEGDRGQVKLIDFGLARPAKITDPLTVSGALVGTPSYLSPEQASGQAIDARSDLFSLGCVLYQMLTGKTPFSGTDLLTVLAQLANDDPKPPAALNRECPAPLSDLVMSLLSKRAEMRPSSAAAVAASLREIEASPSSASHNNSQTICSTEQDRASRHQLARPRLTARVLVMAVALLGIAAAATVLPSYFMPARQQRTEQPPAADPKPTALAPPAAKTPFELGKVPPLMWHNLLQTAPRDLLWQNAGGDSRRDFDPSAEVLWVQSAHQNLFSLGSVPQPGYKLQVGIRQNVWGGNVGVYFGCHPVPGEKGLDQRLQLVELRKPFNKPYFTMCRSRILMRGHIPILETFEACTVPVGEVAGAEHMLEIEVGAYSLQRVRWSGRDLAELTQPSINAYFEPADYTGEFGVYVSRSSGVFRNARFMRLTFRKDEE